MIKGYLIAAVRGPDGDAVDYDAKWENIRTALIVAGWLRAKFPVVDWYIAHEHEKFVEALLAESVTSSQIVLACSRIAAACDICIFYSAKIGEGMIAEKTKALLAGKRVVEIDTIGEVAEEKIATVLAEL